MKFNSKKFSKKIQSNYIDYDTEVGEVFCHISEINKSKSDYDNFVLAIKNFDFFNSDKVNQESLIEMELDFAKYAIITSIVKITQSDKYFIDWDQGQKYATEFLSQFVEIKKIYSNAGFDNDYTYKQNVNELDMNGWTNFSQSYWYDYGFIIISNTKIGILWFGDND